MKQYEMLELAFMAGSEKETINAVFTHKDTKVEIEGFYAGEGISKVRFLPLESGTWSYELTGAVNDDGLFIADKAEAEKVSDGVRMLIEQGLIQPEKVPHGPVTKQSDGSYCLADGTPCEIPSLKVMIPEDHESWDETEAILQKTMEDDTQVLCSFPVDTTQDLIDLAIARVSAYPQIWWGAKELPEELVNYLKEKDPVQHVIL